MEQRLTADLADLRRSADGPDAEHDRAEATGLIILFGSTNPFLGGPSA